VETQTEALRARLDRATAGLDPPLGVVDLGAFRANAARMSALAGATPVRVATKSVRCRALVDEVLARPGFAGVMAFTLPEALWLAGQGASDVLVGYPTADRRALRALAADESLASRVTLMVDDVAQLDLVDAACAPGPSRRPRLRVCLDVDASWWPLGRAGAAVGAHVGVRRSPVHAVTDAARLARAVAGRPGFRLVGLMTYEAQVAGLPDRHAVVRWMKRRSTSELCARRAALVAAVAAASGATDLELEIVNGGGTGSLVGTARDPSVTEVTAGSGLFAPALFDGYRGLGLRPAAWFALPVVRRPSRRLATVLGGGWVASGAAGRDRLPLPGLPAALRLLAAEGAGEVQTPLTGRAASGLEVGDRVWFRHAKAGELCERLDTLHLVEGERVVTSVPTYRGEGRAFA